MAKLYFRYGAMNCGKSTSLIQVVHNYEERYKNCTIIKPEIDTKGKEYIVSRVGIKKMIDLLVNKDMDLRKHFSKDSKLIDCILVDEAQFLTPEQVDQLFELAVCYDIPVICYGLRTDFQMNSFPGSARLLQLAHEIEEMKTICECGKKAVFNMRLFENKPIFEGDQVCIDNMDKYGYKSVCGKCYFEYKNKD